MFPEKFMDPEDTLIITGNYGSGKTEISLNLAFQAAGKDLDVALVDLDVINPYFRSREKDDELQQAGIDIIFPGELKEADLPVISPKIKRALVNENCLAIFDVGGDKEGAVTLSSVVDHLDEEAYEKWLIVNPFRPRTNTPEKIVQTARRISEQSDLDFTGIVANIHLGEETETSIIEKKFPALKKAASRLDVEIKFLAAVREIASQLKEEKYPCPILPLKLYLNPPW